MSRFRILTAGAVLVMTFGLVPAAQAQNNYFSLSYWPAGFTFTGATSATWNTGFIVFDYSGVLRPPFGLRVSYATGGESNWAGGFAGTTSGTDTIWSADLFWERSSGNFSFRPFIGYGSMKLDNNAGGSFDWSASGLRIGAEAIMQSSSPLQFVAAAAWYPSANSESVDLTGADGTGFDWNLGVRWRPPNANWGITAGYRGVGFNCNSGFCNGSSMNWSGFALGATYQW